MTASDWRFFRLEPDDVLFFRDGRPSTMGEDHYLRSLFPFHPSTLYGALRTRRLLDFDVDLIELARGREKAWGGLKDDLRAEVGEYGGFGTLEIRGPWLEKDGKALFPAPMDLGLLKEHDTVREIVRYRPLEAEKARRWSHPLALMVPCRRAGGGWEELSGDEEPQAPAGYFVTAEGLTAWAEGGIPECESLLDASELWAVEPRTGVGLRADRRSHEEGRLYTFGFIRLLMGVTVGFQARGTALKACGALRLGGEGRTAALSEGAPPGLPEPTKGGDGFTMTLLTPALWTSGSYAPGFSPDSTRAALWGKPCDLVAAAVRTSAPLGGYDVRERKPKALRRAVPAGSAFVFGGAYGGHENAVLCDYDEMGRQGFGWMAAGSRA